MIVIINPSVGSEQLLEHNATKNSWGTVFSSHENGGLKRQAQQFFFLIPVGKTWF